MERQGWRLCDPGPRRRLYSVARRLLLECRWPAAVRDGAAPGRSRVSSQLRRDLLISAGPGEWRAAWLEDGVAAELHVERGDAPPAGTIHLGRVLRLVAGLDAALVDIGAERPGFLPVRAGGAAELNEGARVVVQLRREAQRGKGALLSARIVPRAGGQALARLAALAAGLEPPAPLDPPPGFAAALALRLPAEPEEILADDPAILREL